MASNYPKRNSNPTVIIAAMAAVIVLMATVIIVLVMRGSRSSDAQTAKDTTSVTPTPEVTPPPTPSFDDDLLMEFRIGLDELRQGQDSYVEHVPEYDNPYPTEGSPELADNPAQLSPEEVELAQYEAAERELLHGLLALLQKNPEIAQLLQKDTYFGSAFDLEQFMDDYGSLNPEQALEKALNDSLFFLWEKDRNGNGIVLNGQPLLDLDACEIVIRAAQEYLDSFAGYGASKD